MMSSPDSQWTLRVTDDSGADVSIHLDATPKCFGRGEERVDIRLLSSQVSRRHAEIWVGPEGQLLLRDLGSTNGTLVNGDRITGLRTLHHGDEVRVATWAFKAHNPNEVVLPLADEPPEMLTTADSMLAIDALLDSHGNLRDAEVRQAMSSKPAAAAAKAPVPVPTPAAAAAPAKAAEPAIQPVAVAKAAEPAAKPQVKAELKPAAPAQIQKEKAQEAVRLDGAEATLAGMNLTSVDDFVDSHAGHSLFFGGSQVGVPALEDSCSGIAPHQPRARASDLHLVGEGRAPGVSAADLCAVQAFADRQLVVPNGIKRQRLLCEFVVSPVFNRNIAAVVAVQGGKIEVVCGPTASLPMGELHIEKTLVRKAAEEKRAVVAWDAHFASGASAVAVCCPLSGGDYLYALTTFENATPAWMSLVAQTAFMDRLIRKSWQAIDRVRKPASLPISAAA